MAFFSLFFAGDDVSAGGCVHVRPQHPLVLGLELDQVAQSDLVRLQVKTRTHFVKRDSVVLWLRECVVPDAQKRLPKRDDVSVVGEG